MLFFDLPYWFMSFAAVTALGIVLFALFCRACLRRAPVPVEADCRETQLIESGESLPRGCED